MTSREEQDVELAPDDALDALEKMPVEPRRRMLNIAFGSRLDEPPALATARRVPPQRSGDEGRRLAELGYEWVGTRTERSLLGSFSADAFVHPRGLGYVLVRPRRLTLDPIAAGLSRYYILSFFDDGSCLETNEHGATPGDDGPMLVKRSNAGSLSNDLDAHDLAVAEHARSRSARVIAVRDASAVRRLSKEYLRRVIPTSVAATATSYGVAMFALFTIALLAFARWAFGH